ncbi:DNA primase [Rothia kristinae]|nr:DNA primase [Rothia kristinae]
MAGLIRREDIDEVRSRTDIREIVEGYVTLKSAGIGSYKGLCPFHDERTPSFHVRPQMGTYHCFGCGESGDVIAFLMAMDHTGFTETVERLAARVGYELHYENGRGPDREEKGRRQRLVDAHKIAQEFFERQLYTREAAAAQRFLGGRGFDGAAAKRFGVGYAPQGWSHLLKHLRDHGFTEEELKATGMFSEGRRGLYDRFRGRLIWPIRTITGETIGFGARKLFEEDQGPKYLNTPETALYKKSQVLYGIDLAKRKIAQGQQVVVVEGYTDVMAAHLAGVETAVATCGTAFGAGHIKIVRRLLGDDGSGGEVIFTFDGDEAGQKAALHAFQEDQRFTAQTYVCVAPDGMDPCDLRLARGDRAVRDLLETKRPLFEFAIRVTLEDYDLETLEGRVRAMRAVVPMIATIRDPALRPAYARRVAGWIGMEPVEVERAVDAAAARAPVSPLHSSRRRPAGGAGCPPGGDAALRGPGSAGSGGADGAGGPGGSGPAAGPGGGFPVGGAGSHPGALRPAPRGAAGRAGRGGRGQPGARGRVGQRDPRPCGSGGPRAHRPALRRADPGRDPGSADPLRGRDPQPAAHPGARGPQGG